MTSGMGWRGRGRGKHGQARRAEQARGKGSGHTRRETGENGNQISTWPPRAPGLADLRAQNQKGPWNRSSTGQIGGWSSPRSLSQVPAFGALAFAGRRLPDATPHGMRGFRSHGGTALTVAGRGVLSEASLPGSVALCRERLAGQGADTLAMGFASAPLPQGRPRLVAGRWPRVTGLTS